MNTEIPKYVRKFECTKVSSAATTYHLRPVVDSERVFGWALATVNDETGELAIQSDWGTWSYRWHTDHLGQPTLTHFIGLRSDCHYLADKLTGRADRELFDSQRTVDHMQRELAKKRLAWGRDLIDWYRDDEPADRVSVLDDNPPRRFHNQRVWCRHLRQDEPLTREIARRLFDELEELRGELHAETFTNRFFEIEGSNIISDEPWHEDLKYTPSTSYMQLLHGILPALAEACRARVGELAA
jgi:hypothetical protein